MRKELLKAMYVTSIAMATNACSSVMHCSLCSKLSHRNLSSFIGCITKDETLTGVLYEHTTRGSLHQLLLKPSFEMNETFRVSFTLGAVNGLHYLHSKGLFHCRLNSLNCLIDEYWCLKLTSVCVCVHYIWRNHVFLPVFFHTDFWAPDISFKHT